MAFETNLFPLPVTPLEHFCFAMDCPTSPMAFWAKFILKGRFEPFRFHQALQVVLQRHPLLHTLVKGNPQDKTADISWIHDPKVFPWVDWGAWDESIHPRQGEFIDLHRENGMRLFIREGENQTQFFTQIHHACCDGPRGLELFEDLLTAYAGIPFDTLKKPILSRHFLESLKERGKFRFGGLTRAIMFVKNIHHLLNLRKKNISPVYYSKNSGEPNPNWNRSPSYHTFRFEEGQSKIIKAKAKSQEVSINDLFLRDLFLTLYRWNCLHLNKKEKMKFRVALPIDLQYALKTPMPASNRAGMVLIDRVLSNSTDAKKLLKNIRSEIWQLRKWNTAYSFIRGAAVLGRKKSRLPEQLKDPRFFPTIFFTNLGPLLYQSPLRGIDGRIRAGDLELIDVDTVAPCLSWSPMNLTLSSYDHRLKLGLQFDYTKVTAQQAREFLDLFVSQILEGCESP